MGCNFEELIFKWEVIEELILKWEVPFVTLRN
jgi:hypothetical protein